MRHSAHVRLFYRYQSLLARQCRAYFAAEMYAAWAEDEEANCDPNALGEGVRLRGSIPCIDPDLMSLGIFPRANRQPV